MYKSIKTTKCVQASTIAGSSFAMLEQHGSTRSSRLARRVERVESCRDTVVESRRDERSGIWALLIRIQCLETEVLQQGTPPFYCLMFVEYYNLVL